MRMWCPSVRLRKCRKSPDSRHGSWLARPITSFSETATTSSTSAPAIRPFSFGKRFYTLAAGSPPAPTGPTLGFSRPRRCVRLSRLQGDQIAGRSRPASRTRARQTAFRVTSLEEKCVFAREKAAPRRRGLAGGVFQLEQRRICGFGSEAGFECARTSAQGVAFGRCLRDRGRKCGEAQGGREE